MKMLLIPKEEHYRKVLGNRESKVAIGYGLTEFLAVLD